MTHDHTHSHHHHHDHGNSHDPAPDMTLAQKLEKLLTHWIDHNDSHKQTFDTWAGRAAEEGLSVQAEKIAKAAALSGEVTVLLKAALRDLDPDQ